MKKLLGISAVLLALGLVLTGCASKKSGPVPVHPRSYTFDVIDAGADVLELTFNQYGPNYQVTPYLSTLVKTDNPQAGDTITFKMKAVSDVDLPLLLAYPLSTAPSWSNLADESFVFAENVKAGEPFECEFTCVLTKNMGSDFGICLQYDNPEQEVKTNGPCKLTLERICESTDTRKEFPEDPHVSEVTLAVETYAAFLEIATNHPWVNGTQDMSKISNYEAGPEVTKAFGKDLPRAGDTLTVTWRGVSDRDIAQIYIRPVDRSAAANWWKELLAPNWQDDVESLIIAKDVKAGEPFEGTVTFNIAADAMGAVNLCIWYNIGDTSPDGPSIIKKVIDPK